MRDAELVLAGLEQSCHRSLSCRFAVERHIGVRNGAVQHQRSLCFLLSAQERRKCCGDVRL